MILFKDNDVTHKINSALSKKADNLKELHHLQDQNCFCVWHLMAVLFSDHRNAPIPLPSKTKHSIHILPWFVNVLSICRQYKELLLSPFSANLHWRNCVTHRHDTRICVTYRRDRRMFALHIDVIGVFALHIDMTGVFVLHIEVTGVFALHIDVTGVFALQIDVIGGSALHIGVIGLFALHIELTSKRDRYLLLLDVLSRP